MDGLDGYFCVLGGIEQLTFLMIVNWFVNIVILIFMAGNLLSDGRDGEAAGNAGRHNADTQVLSFFSSSS